MAESQYNSDNSKMKLSSFQDKKPIMKHKRGKSSGAGGICVIEDVPTPPESSSEEDSDEMPPPTGTEEWRISKVSVI